MAPPFGGTLYIKQAQVVTHNFVKFGPFQIVSRYVNRQQSIFLCIAMRRLALLRDYLDDL